MFASKTNPNPNLPTISLMKSLPTLTLSRSNKVADASAELNPPKVRVRVRVTVRDSASLTPPQVHDKGGYGGDGGGTQHALAHVMSAMCTHEEQPPDAPSEPGM